jgi:signal transduction histidine kinase
MADRAPTTSGVVPAHVARRAVAGALAAELAHDLQGPVNLFRMSTDRLERGELLDAEDVALLREELERLTRLNARLRELARTSLQIRPCSPRELVELALLGLPHGELLIDVPSEPSLDCDPALLSQALRELLDNALEARSARAGIRFEAGAGRGFCVWDDGPGPALGGNAALVWGATTREGAAGLGLTLALRAARAHGFDLQLRRAAQLTEAWLSLPTREPRRGEIT